MITVKLVQQKRELSLPGPASVKRILEELGMKKTTSVVICEKRILTLDKTIEDGREVEIISVVSGG